MKRAIFGTFASIRGGRGLVALTVFGLGGCAAGGDLPGAEPAADPTVNELRLATSVSAVGAVKFASAADLKPDGTMRFYGGAPYDIGVQINVTNVGSLAATGPSGTILIAGQQVPGALYQYWGGTATAPNTVNPGEHGYIEVHLPPGTLAPCNQYPVEIDVSRTMQSGTPDPFANDQATVSTQCLQWTSPITTDDFSISDPLINGKSLGRIVSSQDIGRRDGFRCSHCHFDGSGLPYSPPVARDGSATIRPTDVIAGRTWAGANGWSRAFLAQPTDDPTQVRSKPFYLQELVQTWIDDGERSGPFLVVSATARATTTAVFAP